MTNVREERFFKVPAAQRKENPPAYEPHLFSFGLYHSSVVPHGGDHFQQLTQQALLNPAAFTSLTDKLSTDVVPKIQDLYVELMNGSSRASDIATALARHGITIVAAMIVSDKRVADSLQWQPPFAYPIVQMIFEDALLLENQVPIIVLQHAVDSVNLMPGTLNLTRGTLTLQDVLHWYCHYASPFKNCPMQDVPRLDCMTKSLLSIIYTCLTQGQHDPFDGETTPLSHTASHLAMCGVRFRPSKKAHFQAISFNKKTMVLEIPEISVGEDTVRFLHNLLAYEATSRYPFECSVGSFVLFMDYLIDTKEDVIILVEAGILRNNLGSHEKLATMWNNLCKSITCSATESDHETMEGLEEFSKSRLRRWLASFREKYWDKQPWLLVSIIAGVILLISTVLQTAYTIKGAK